MDRKELGALERYVIRDRGTEPPFTGRFDRHFEDGLYLCRQCGAALYRSGDKFDAGCGWPAFDDEIKGAVVRTPDPDGRRTEISCARCGGHLGHVFEGEGHTPKNLRHCVNSVSLDFLPAKRVGRAVFAGGCFWGVEALLDEVHGVVATTAGYTGGSTENPGYDDVRSGRTGHAEAVEVLYDRAETNFETLARRFFEIHDPTQVDRQGPDIGSQYRSAIFCTDDEQEETARRLLGELRALGVEAVTSVERAGRFWPAEDHHQDYYRKRGIRPECRVDTPWKSGRYPKEQGT